MKPQPNIRHRLLAPGLPNVLHVVETMGRVADLDREEQRIKAETKEQLAELRMQIKFAEDEAAKGLNAIRIMRLPFLAALRTWAEINWPKFEGGKTFHCGHGQMGWRREGGKKVFWVIARRADGPVEIPEENTNQEKPSDRK